jgi:hypothetical protein
MTEFTTPIAFAVRRAEPPAIEIRINFGILAGRDATPAEIDELGRTLLTIVPDVSIVSEQHYEIGQSHEAVVHLVKIELDGAEAPGPEVEERLVAAATEWAEACAEARHAEL